MKQASIEFKIDHLNAKQKAALLKAIVSTDPEIVAVHLDQIREGTAEALQGVEVTTLPTEGAEETPEQLYLGELKARFYTLPELHEGVEWADVERSLEADPKSREKLIALDALGHKMNVFGVKNGEIVFRSAQTDVTQIAAEHRNIMYDKKAETYYPQYTPNGNAEDVANSMGVELADKELYEQLRVQAGWVYLKTDATTRKAGYAVYGSNAGVGKSDAGNHMYSGSFCAALRVKKV